MTFQIFVNDNFPCLKKCELANYADSTMYSSDKNIKNIMTSLNHDFAILSNWFYKNFIVVNPDKSFFLLIAVKDEFQTDRVSNNVTIENSKEEKLLRIIFQIKLDFSSHLTSITKKANIKLNNLTVVKKYPLL